jgi:hypothetical protein
LAASRRAAVSIGMRATCFLRQITPGRLFGMLCCIPPADFDLTLGSIVLQKHSFRGLTYGLHVHYISTLRMTQTLICLR